MIACFVGISFASLYFGIGNEMLLECFKIDADSQDLLIAHHHAMRAFDHNFNQETTVMSRVTHPME